MDKQIYAQKMKGDSLLKVTGIILIILGAGAAINSFGNSGQVESEAMRLDVDAGFLVATSVYGRISTAFTLIVLGSSDPFGIDILMMLAIAAIIIIIIGFVLPILFTVGAYRNKRFAAQISAGQNGERQ
jgi:hypothetical protein